jgi:hypothetical protein
VVILRPGVSAALREHGLDVGPDDTPATLRERLNQMYLVEVRALRARQRGGEIPLSEYAGHARALQERFPLLGLPLGMWEVELPDLRRES